MNLIPTLYYSLVNLSSSKIVTPITKLDRPFGSYLGWSIARGSAGSWVSDRSSEREYDLAMIVFPEDVQSLGVATDIGVIGDGVGH